MKNYYAVLGLSRNASQDQVKLAYRENAKKYHPDLNPGNEKLKQRFLDVKEAYEVLSDPVKKKAYDDEIVAIQRARAAAQQQAQQQAAQQQAAQARQSSAQQQSPVHAAGQQPPFQTAAQQQSVPFQYRPVPVPPYQRQFSESRNSSVKYTPPQIEEIKKLYDKQLSVIRGNSKKEMQEFKKRLMAQIDAHKKHSSIKLKQLASQYKSDVERARKEAKKYKENYRKSSFNAGMAVGIKEAYDDCKKTIDGLKKIIQETSDELETLRTEKQRLEEKYFAAAKSDKSDSSAIISLHREKIEVETEFAKTKTILRSLEIKLMQKEADYRQLEAELDLLQQTSQNEASLDGKEKKDLEEKLDIAEEKLKAAQDLLVEKDDELEEQAKIIEELRGRVSELTRHTKEFGKIISDNPEDSEAYEAMQTELAAGTLYGTLGIHLHALPQEIDDAFDRLTALYKGKKEHIERYIEIIEAYNILNNDEAKAEYDQSIGNSDEI